MTPLVTALCLVLFAPQGDAGGADDVAAQLRDQFESGVGAETTVAISTLPTRPIDESYEGVDPEEDWTERIILSCRGSGPLVLFRAWVGDPTLYKIDEEGEPHIVSYWDGSSYVEILTRRRHVIINEKWPNSHHFDCLSLFLGMDAPALSPNRSLPNLLEIGEMLEREEDDKRIKLHLSLEPTLRADLFLTILKGPKLRVSDMRMRHFTPRDAEGERKQVAEVRYHVAEWMEHGGAIIPKVAYRDALMKEAAFNASENRDPYRNRVVFERQSIRASEEQLTPADLEAVLKDYVTEEWTVDDRRARIQYQPGGREVVVDGYRFATSKPVPLLPVDQLSSLLQGAEPQQFHRELTSEERAAEWRGRLLQAGAAGTATFLAVTGLVWMRRRPHSRK